MITDELLLLYHLGDGLSAAERAALAEQLAADALLRERLARLAAEQDELRRLASPPVVVPEDTRRRWHAALERAAADTREQVTHRSSPAAAPPRRWPLFAALASSAFALVVSLRLFMPLPAPPGPALPAEGIVHASADNLRFERSVRLYLGEARRQVEGLPGLTPEQRDEVVNQVLAHNRLYIAAAERASAPAVARSLRALNPVLESLDTDAGDRNAFEGGVAQVDFEMKVIQARLGRHAPAHERWAGRPMAL